MTKSGFGRLVAMLAFCWITAAWVVPPPLLAQSPAPAPAPASGLRHAIVIVGLAGDAEHRVQFQEITTAWTNWLHGDLGFDAANIVLLSGRDRANETPDQEVELLPYRRAVANREAIREQVQELNSRLREDDSLWVFFLGHANYDDEHAFFHLPGPDMNEDDLAELFAGTKCCEQVFWLTHACSGWFLKSLSQKGRIVITATAADREYNETEFPAALAETLQLGKDKLDSNQDGRISIAELFTSTTSAVAARFSADRRAPTEHAQLDDNGDGFGTESDRLRLSADDSQGTSEVPVTGNVRVADGQLAAATFLPAAKQQRAGQTAEFPKNKE